MVSKGSLPFRARPSDLLMNARHKHSSDNAEEVEGWSMADNEFRRVMQCISEFRLDEINFGAVSTWRSRLESKAPNWC